MKRVCHLTSVHSSDDTRVFHKECVSLARAGYDVTLVAPGESREELGVHIGDTVRLFGPGAGETAAEPTADDWARAADTISYEIFTCLRNRVPRLYLHAHDVLAPDDVARLDPRSLL